MGRNENFTSFGYSKTSDREYKLWDLKNLAKPIVSNKIDNSASSMLPYYDIDRHILYLFGKGAGNIRYYEYA